MRPTLPSRPPSDGGCLVWLGIALVTTAAVVVQLALLAGAIVVVVWTLRWLDVIS